MNALVIATQMSPSEAFSVFAIIAFIVVATVRRRRRRATMTQAERLAEDTRDELRGIRRALNRRR